MSVSCTSQEYDNVTTSYYPFSLHQPSSGRLREVKNKGKVQTFNFKSGHGRLREVVAYKRFQIQRFDSETFGILENWSPNYFSFLVILGDQQLYVFLIYFLFN